MSLSPEVEAAFGGPGKFTSNYFSVPPAKEDPECKVAIHYLLHKSAASKEGKDRKVLLLIHGHPQNRLIWHRVCKQLVSDGDEWDIVIPDMRGRGLSSCPIVPPEAYQQSELAHMKERYSKRTVARDLVLLMESLNLPKFYVVGHDRGGRVAHRLLADHGDSVHKAIILDIAPTLDMYNQTDATFATVYWHWFFLLKQQPPPENFLVAAPETYLGGLVARFPTSGGKQEEKQGEETFQLWALESYKQGISTFELAHGCVECYRASAPGGVDLTLDAEDREAGKRIAVPTVVIWGQKGWIQMGYKGGLDLWKKTMDNVTGYSVNCGHYIPEEKPSEVLKAIKDFFV